MAKRIIRLTEAELGDLIIKNMIGNDPSKMLDNILGAALKYKGKGANTEVSKKLDQTSFAKDNDSKNLTNNLSTNKDYYDIDLSTKTGYDAYKEIANNFISTRSSNLLNINGSMLADAAKSAYDKYRVYVPVELALAQLVQEGGFTSNANSRPIRTKNPFNVGNVDSGSNIFHSSVMSGINRYYDLMAKNYLSSNKSVDDLLRNFVNKAGNRYATDRQYEQKLKGIVDGIRRNSDQVYTAVAKSKTSDIA
jgi:hypothetical protein